MLQFQVTGVAWDMGMLWFLSNHIFSCWFIDRKEWLWKGKRYLLKEMPRKYKCRKTFSISKRTAYWDLHQTQDHDMEFLSKSSSVPTTTDSMRFR